MKKVSDRRKMKKKSAKDSCELAIKSATGSTWKKSATSATSKRNQRRTCAGCQKKVNDSHILGKISDGRKLGITSHVRNLKRKSARDSCDTEKQICDMRNLGKNQGRARPGKKPAMRATWIKKKQRARPVKNVSGRRKLKKKSATESCELAIKSATGSTWKKSATGATWKRNQRRTCACCQKKVSDRHILGKISDGRKLGITSHVRNLKRKPARDSRDTEKKSATCLT